MSDAAVSLLTAPGSAAIAVVEVRGPQAYPLAKQLFAPAGKPLPDAPEVGRFWFGTLGADEVVLSVTDAEAIEVHCHGGPRVVRWVIEQFTLNGAEERTRTPHSQSEGFAMLQRVPTLRTASVLLDQLNGAFAAEVRRILARLETDPASAAQPLARLARLGNTVGRHLVVPWKVVIAGPPNVGKSSLVNALAGYQRAVVSDVAGTTRDAVGVRVAFDGWPVELIDTAGLREVEGLEAEGIELTVREMAGADLVVWLMDCSELNPVWAPDTIPQARLTACVTKSDLPGRWCADDQGDAWGLPLVSAATGDVRGLIHDLLSKTVPAPPAHGDAVPFTSRLVELVNAANTALAGDQPAEAARLLRDALAAAE